MGAGSVTSGVRNLASIAASSASAARVRHPRPMADEFPAERHVYGRVDAPVTILEFGDLECPDCRAAAGPLRELVDTSEGRVRLVWRRFPLFEVHPYALWAALASEAAGRHGK